MGYVSLELSWFITNKIYLIPSPIHMTTPPILPSLFYLQIIPYVLAWLILDVFNTEDEMIEHRSYNLGTAGD